MTEPVQPQAPAVTPVDITPQPTPAPAVDPFDAILADPAKVDRLLSHPQATARLNAIVASHVARIKPAAQPAQPAEPKPVDGRLADLEASLAQEREARQRLEAERRSEAEDRQIEAALRAKGVPADRVDAARVYLKSTALRRTEDGRPQVVVRRVRAAGQPAQELAYEDLSHGVADWLADPSAQMFLPAPAPIGARVVRPLAVNPATGKVVAEAPKGNGIQAADAAFAEYLERSGVRY